MGDGLIHAVVNTDNSLNPKQGDSAIRYVAKQVA
jgi:hypothetical protein